MYALNPSQMRLVTATYKLGGCQVTQNNIRQQLKLKTTATISHNLCVLERHGLIEPLRWPKHVTLTEKGKKLAVAIENVSAELAA